MDTHSTLYSYFTSQGRNDKPLSWNKLLAKENCYPELQKEALYLIKTALGYLPPQNDYLECCPFIRTYIYQFQNGLINQASFEKEVSQLIQQIRNQQMRIENRTRIFEPKDYEAYQTLAPDLREIARVKLCEFLGYQPEIDHSLEAELIIRLSYFVDNAIVGDASEDILFFAATIALYRKTWFSEGEKFANRIPLLGTKLKDHKTYHWA